MYHIQIVGAGYTGSRIAAYFREKKQKVWALTRSGKRNAEFESLGVTPVVADLTRPETLENIHPAHFIVICPAPGETRDEGAYQKIYIDGIGNYLQAIRKNPKPNLIVYLSSTGVYRDREGAWVDESTPPEPDSEKGKILLAAEEQVLNSGFPALIFRLAGIYGPGRNVIARRGAIHGAQGGINPAPTMDALDRWTNHIHVDDIAGAMPVLFNKGEAAQIYLGVDDEPVLKSELDQWLNSKFQRRGAIHGAQGVINHAPTAVAGKRCSNKKLKSLGYAFKYPTYREGYSSFDRKIQL